MIQISKNILVIICAVIVMAAVPGGCASPKVGYSAKQQYVLGARRDAEKISPVGTSVVKVRPFRVSNRFDCKTFLYRTDEMSYESDFYHEFLGLPGPIITEEVKEWLAASGLFSNVIDTGSRAEGRFVLEGNVLALYGDYTDKDNPQAVIEIHFLLINTTISAGSIVFDETYESVVPLESSRSEALVQGWNTCLKQILEALEKDLQEIVQPDR